MYAQFLRSSQKGTLFHHGFKRKKRRRSITPNLSKISNLECKTFIFLNVPCRVLSTKTEEITVTPTLLSAFWTYTLITAMTPDRTIFSPLALLRRMDFVKVPCAGRDESGIFDCDVTVCGHSFSLAVIDPAAVHLLSWAGAHILSGWRGKSPPAQQRKTDSGKTNQLLGQLCFAVCERQNILYGVTALSTFVLPQTQALSG